MRDDEDDYTHSIVKILEYCEGPFIELIKEIEFELTDLLSYVKLKGNGLNSRLMGPQRVDERLYEYLSYVEQIHCSEEHIDKYLNDLSIEKLHSIVTGRKVPDSVI